MASSSLNGTSDQGPLDFQGLVSLLHPQYVITP